MRRLSEQPYLSDKSGFMLAQCLRRFVGFRSDFEVHTARPAVKRPVQSSNLDIAIIFRSRTSQSLELFSALYDLVMRGSMWERFLIRLVVKKAAESGHCAEVVIVQSDFSRIPSAALSLTFKEVGTEHCLEHRRGARQDCRRDTKARLLEHQDHIALGSDVDVDHFGRVRSFAG